MSSSPTTCARVQLPGRSDLLSLFASVPDPRHRRGVRHPLPVILALGVAAVLTGARSFAAIGEWVADQPEPALARLGVGTGPRPTESTIRRAFTRLDADLLDRAIMDGMANSEVGQRAQFGVQAGQSRGGHRRMLANGRLSSLQDFQEL